MKIHELKCKSEFFEQIEDGSKPFEIRKADREFSVGDILALNEIQTNSAIYDGSDVESIEYTGRCCVVIVTSVLNDPQYCKEGYVTLGIHPCGLSFANDDLFSCRRGADYHVPVYTGRV